MKYPCLLFMLGLGLFGEALAQDIDNPTPSLPDASALAPGNSNRLQLQQVGQDQAATAGQSGQQQQLRIFQEGEAQQLQLFQSGDNNNWDVVQQGIGNDYTGVLHGNQNDVQVQQRGAYNSLQQDLLGNRMDYSITQEGNFLELIQIENHGRAPAYQVQQQGEGMRIIIENGFQPLPE